MPIAFSSHWLLNMAASQFHVFLFVLLRMSGLMIIGPIFGHGGIPTNVRVFMALALALMITPLIHSQSDRGFLKLDTNKDTYLEASEVPESLKPRFQRLLKNAEKTEEEGLTAAEFRTTPPVPSTLFDFIWVSAGEIFLGMALGLGVAIILGGIQLAGEIFDQQAGIALSEIFNPGSNSSSSPTGQTLYMLAVVLFLVMEPISGHLMMMSALIETFEFLPVGESYLATAAVPLLSTLIYEALILAIQIAAPILATMSLISIAMGFLGYTVPQINILVLGFPIRAMLSVFLILFATSGIGRLVIDTIPNVIYRIQEAFYMGMI